MTLLRLGTKAETLEVLRQAVTTCRIKPSCIFSVGDWETKREEVLARVMSQFQQGEVIVRSSAQNEDSASSSNAGRFLSVGHVPVKDAARLNEAILAVIGSYGTAKEDDQVFVQEQIGPIKTNGVLFTRDMNTGAPYYIINFDASSGCNDAVTSGKKADLQTYVHFRESKAPPHDYNLRVLLEAAKEIEKLLGRDCLDIEFIFTTDEQLYIVQARPLIIKKPYHEIATQKFGEYLYRIYRKLEKNDAPYPGLHGAKALYSVMTDWNPAEMIGTRPRTLALSLYRELITDSVWAYQRDNYGYRNLRGFPLMLSFIGCPYIDVRVSLNSFVPKTLDETLSGKLVNYYLEQLTASPADHDKVEFNIVFSCYYLGLPAKLKKLLNFGFTELELDRIKFALLSLSNRILGDSNGCFDQDLQRIEVLNQRYGAVTTGKLPLLDQIYWLLEDGKRYGTLPFAGLARAAFIAVQFLQSLVESGLLSAEERQQYLNSLNTVAGQLSADTAAHLSGRLSRNRMLQKYGHLRPGTYDILSPRYDEAYERYFGSHHQPGFGAVEHQFKLSPDRKKHISRCLEENGIAADCDSLFAFIKRAIEAREYSKFIFTRSISQVLRLVEELGTRNGLDKERMSHANIKTILDLYANLSSAKLSDILNADIVPNEEEHKLSQMIRLPQLIRNKEDVYGFFQTRIEPNYVTLKKVTAVIVAEEEFPNVQLNGRIVIVRSADPGYDWMFSRDIAGLVTAYGGANSHMAIRCSELQIPAVIGCGEENFEKWSRAQTLELDCENKQVHIIK